MLPFQTINGQLVPSDQASIRVNDLGLLRGYGVFDYFLIREGKSVFLKEHIARFFRSATQLYLKVPFTETALEQQVAELVKANGIQDAAIRMLLTGGYADNGFTPSGLSNCIIIQHEFRLPEAAIYQKGMHLMLHEYQRDLPEAKSTNYLMPIRLQSAIQEMGADDVLYHFNHFVSETSRANLFIITADGSLVTSIGNILKGVTRNKVLTIAQKQMSVKERLFTLEELWAAKEIFVTSTTKGILAVTQINGQLIGDGKPGLKTLSLTALLRDYTESHMAEQKVLL